MKSQGNIHSTWTKDCKVFIRRSADHEPELISNIPELSDPAVNPLDSTPAMPTLIPQPGILPQPAGILASTTPSLTAVYHYQAPPTVLQPPTMPVQLAKINAASKPPQLTAYPIYPCCESAFKLNRDIKLYSR